MSYILDTLSKMEQSKSTNDAESAWVNEITKPKPVPPKKTKSIDKTMVVVVISVLFGITGIFASIFSAYQNSSSKSAQISQQQAAPEAPVAAPHTNPLTPPTIAESPASQQQSVTVATPKAVLQQEVTSAQSAVPLQPSLPQSHQRQPVAIVAPALPQQQITAARTLPNQTPSLPVPAYQQPIETLAIAKPAVATPAAPPTPVASNVHQYEHPKIVTEPSQPQATAMIERRITPHETTNQPGLIATKPPIPAVDMATITQSRTSMPVQTHTPRAAAVHHDVATLPNNARPTPYQQQEPVVTHTMQPQPSTTFEQNQRLPPAIHTNRVDNNVARYDTNVPIEQFGNLPATNTGSYQVPPRITHAAPRQTHATDRRLPNNYQPTPRYVDPMTQTMANQEPRTVTTVVTRPQRTAQQIQMFKQRLAPINLTQRYRLSSTGAINEQQYATIDGMDYGLGDNVNGLIITDILKDRIYLHDGERNRYVIAFRY